MQQLEWTCREFYWVKKSQSQMVPCCVISLIFLKLQNCRNREQVSDSHQFRRKRGIEKFCLDFIDANILCCCTVVLQDFTFGDNWVKGTQALSVLFFKKRVCQQLSQILKSLKCGLNTIWAKIQFSVEDCFFKKSTCIPFSHTQVRGWPVHMFLQ